jgi:hypothetical protein
LSAGPEVLWVLSHVSSGSLPQVLPVFHQSHFHGIGGCDLRDDLGRVLVRQSDGKKML